MAQENHTERLAALRHELASQKDAAGLDQNRLNTIANQYHGTLSWAARAYFPSMYPDKTAARRFSGQQTAGGLLALLLMILGLILAPLGLLIGINIIFTLYCFALLVLRLCLFLPTLSSRETITDAVPPSEQENLPVITLLVPLYQEAASLPYLHKALNCLHYPRDRLDIKILLEEDDHETFETARKICTEQEYQVLVVPATTPRTKPKACNFGLWLARGTYTVIYDAEDRPEPDQLLKAVAKFAHSPRKVACLQARLNYYNRQQNILTRLCTLEYTLLFDVLLPGLNRMKVPVPLGGTSNFFRTDVLLEIGGWDPFNVTEDADIGLRLAREGYRCDTLQSTTWEEATPDLHGWLRQRSRWIKGYLQTWLVHSRGHSTGIFSPDQWRWMISLHLFVGAVLVSAFINPFFWAIYLLWAFDLSSTVQGMFQPPIDVLATAGFLGGNLFLLYMYIAAPLKRRWYAYCGYALLLPGYWALQSIAGWIALRQFFQNPFYWEKTEHHPDWVSHDSPGIRRQSGKA